MASRADVARLASTGRVRAGAVRVAGQPRYSRRDVTHALWPFLTDRGPIPPARPATESQAMGLPPFGRAVAIIANALASTDTYARRFNSEYRIWERVPDQPSILTDPYPLSTPWHYRWGVAEDAILYGNTFGLYGDLDWRTGRPGWTIPLPADEVWIITDPARPAWYQWAIGGVTFDVDEIFHVPFGARSGEILGRGVLAQYGFWLAGADDAEQYSRDTFAAGALPPAVITSSRVGNQNDADELKKKWRELTSTREPVIFPDGTELKPVVGNAEQQQLVQARTWNAQQAANIVGVPGWKLGLDGPSMTYQNIETADIDFVRDSVDRYGKPLTAAVTKWLLPAGTEAVWDYSSRMRADAKTTAEIQTTYVEKGVLTVDEVRAQLDRRPLPPDEAPAPGGDASPAADDPTTDAANKAAVQQAVTETSELAGTGVLPSNPTLGGVS